MLVLSHRGYHASVPENTHEAFERAIAMGVDGIETDVRMSADGVPILFHDRLAPDGRKVNLLTRNELSGLVGYPVPTLEDALEKWDGVLWNLEIKAPSALDATVSIVSRFSPSRRFLITSSWYDLVEQISQRLDIELGIVVAHRPFDLGSVSLGRWRDHGRINTVVWKYQVLDTTLLKQTAAGGIQNFVYGVETLSEHQLCTELKIDGVITGHPQYLLKSGRGVSSSPQSSLDSRLHPPRLPP